MLAFEDVSVRARRVGTNPAAANSVLVIMLTSGPTLLPGVETQAKTLGSKTTVVAALPPVNADRNVSVVPTVTLAVRLSVFARLKSVLPPPSTGTVPTGMPAFSRSNLSPGVLFFEVSGLRENVCETSEVLEFCR